MHTYTKEVIGYLDVDSGTIMMGDPCYYIPDELEPDNPNHKLTYEETTGGDDLQATNDFFGQKGYYAGTHTTGQTGRFITVGTAWGDGSYPVIAERDFDGRILRVTIDFDPQIDDET